MINARLTAYSAAMAGVWRSVPTRSRVLAALALTDAPWALARNGAGDEATQRGRFAGAALVLWIAWPTLVSVGVLVGPVLGEIPVAGLLPGLTLGFLVVPQLRQRPGLVAATAAAVAAVGFAHLPTGPALLASAVAGAAGGCMAHRWIR